MPVSNKMIEVLGGEDVTPASTLNQVRGSSKIMETVQAIINAAWTEFDFTDLSEIEQDKPYLIIHRCGISDARLEDWEGDISWHNDEGLPFGEVTHYADPNDLLYVQGSDDV